MIFEAPVQFAPAQRVEYLDRGLNRRAILKRPPTSHGNDDTARHRNLFGAFSHALCLTKCMKRALCLFALLFGVVLPSFSAGIIIIHDADFWPPPWPHPPRPPRPIAPPRPIPPPPAYLPLEMNYTKVDVRIKD